jgi:hypothetical protein
MKTLKITTLVIFILIITTKLVSQPFVGDGISQADLYRNAKNNINYKNLPPDKKINAVQTHFIKEMFLKKIFEQNKLFMTYDDDPVFSGGNKLVNELIMDELAKTLSKKDLLGMKKAYLKNKQQNSKNQQNSKGYKI